METTINRGALELRMLYNKNISRGLILAGLVHFALIGSYQLVTQFFDSSVEFPKKFGSKIIEFIPPPPSYENRQVLPQPLIGAAAAPSVGMPIPVPDATISPEAIFATQEEMNQPVIGTETGDPNGIIDIPENTTIEEKEPEAFVPVQKMPEIVRSVFPPYPEIARRAGVEGTVYVKMWVTKEGKVKKAEVVRSSADLFNQFAVDAAMQWTFTPAIMNNGPVAVWVTVPFRFQLKTR